MNLLTTNLHEGAWLLSQGMSLEKLWHSGNGKKSIVFEFAGAQSELLLEEYRKGKALGNVVKYSQAVDLLKDRMFSLLRGETIQMRQRKGRYHARTYQETIQR